MRCRNRIAHWSNLDSYRVERVLISTQLEKELPPVQSPFSPTSVNVADADC